ncbi:hypothetical protein ACFL3V_00095 [Nanoarchaeota archaeon]
MAQKSQCLDDLTRQVTTPILDKFAEMMLEITACLGDAAPHTSLEFAEQIGRYMESGSLTEEGKDFLVGYINEQRTVKDTYYSFMKAVGKSILERR